MKNRTTICSLIWTFNPEIRRFRKVLASIKNQVNKIVVVDNGSSNIEEIENLCKKFNSMLIKIGFNSGVHALNVGMEFILKKINPQFILLLDQDSILYTNAIPTILSEMKKACIGKFFGAIQIHYMHPIQKKQEGKFVPRKYGIFSGSLIRTEVIRKGLKVREEFFLDQADFDFYYNIRKLGFPTFLYGKKLMEHRVGRKAKLPLFQQILKKRGGWIYQPPWRFYYMVRNSTVLLFEGKMDIRHYLTQIILYTIPLIFVDGIFKTLKALIFGLIHGLFKKLGPFNPLL